MPRFPYCLPIFSSVFIAVPALIKEVLFFGEILIPEIVPVLVLNSWVLAPLCLP